MTPALRAATLWMGCVLLQTPAFASQTVLTQPPGTTFANTSAIYKLPGDPGFTWSLDQDEEVWAYFTAPATASFNRITWYGSLADGAFAVDFFAASCFSCGINWVTSEGRFSSNLLPSPGPFAPAALQRTPVAGPVYAYTLDLPGSVTLAAGGLYALSVVNNYSTAPFHWAASASGLGSHAQYIVGSAMVLRAPGNLAFTLSDTTTPVPEPAVSALFAVGMLALMGAACQHRSRR